MKQFSVSNQLTLVGKAWEIRNQLQQLLIHSSTLCEYLELEQRQASSLSR